MACICLLVLCGIPGAGKSTWAKKFLSYIQEKENHSSSHNKQSDILSDNDLIDKADREGAGEGIGLGKGQETYRVVHIAYDDLIPEELEVELIHDAQNHSREAKGARWKTYRRAIVRCVDDLIAELSSLSRLPGHTTCGSQTVTDEKAKAAVDEGDVTGHVKQDFRCEESHQECLVMDDTSVTEVTNKLSQSQLTAADDKSSQNSTSLSQIHNFSSSCPYASFTNDSEGLVDGAKDPAIELEQLKPDQNAENISGIDSMEAVPDFLKTMFDDVVRQQIKGESSSTVRWVLVIDDNMYYSSMRYEFYQLARKSPFRKPLKTGFNFYMVFGTKRMCSLYDEVQMASLTTTDATGFAQVYFPVELTTALQRNQTRRRQVDELVILDMLNRLERPCVEISWQIYTAIWISENWNQSCFQNVLRLIDEAMSHPVMPVSEDKAAAVESRSICLASLLHQADVALRKILGEHIATAKDVIQSKTERSHLAASSNLIRKQILDDLRSQTLSIPDGMVLETSTDIENPFHCYLRSLFYQRLKTKSENKR